MGEALPPSLEHELKTALAMIVGYAELLQTREDEETRREASEGILQAARRLSSTIDSVIEPAALASEDETLITPAAPRTPERPAPAPQRPLNVLVVDGEPAARTLLDIVLPVEDVRLSLAQDGDEALLSVDHADLVLLAWELPGRTAPIVLAELKIRHPDVPVVVFSEGADSRQEALAKLLGADAFVTREMNLTLLRETATALLGNRLRPLSGEAS